ncbi:M16 family metallopeptidase [Clostridium chauvoei]|uniref:Insulinase family protein n=2 Tax=Clostridium chauvoei TaxID=46867 RepID=A0ABD4RJL0_9CLOT|nr:pitrilysin family protein [Clostridium chauvoei]ATD54979.1 peptidase M16 [Clostridium chauvoei]ATD57344.1 peptidase M16 [Clostridium chauvoei]MBX7281520.1 insulinase family protein [Clostridium chauvoei]MBX7284033.1 insulinase family protein [Clostridium chauvoei]MBX7286568.1 insulinase family protein [Clostridium chauvoei]
MYNLYTLKNGLRVVTEYIEHVNSISVGVMVQNGSRNEDIEVNGISHFIEHMFFKGTYKRTSKEIVQEIENVGGQINAYTSKEATCYYIKALNTHLELSIDILSDMILNSKFDEEEIEKEKGVVIEEINMSEDTPEDVLENDHSKAIFGENSLSYPILGTIESVKSFTREKIMDFINSKYTPYNSVISICGKFDEKELKRILEEYFGGWESNNIYIPKYNTPILLNDSKYTNKQIEQLHINLSFKGLPYAHTKGYSLVLLNNIFGGGASSILFQKVREELGLCYTIYSYGQPYLGTGIVNIYTGVSKQYADKALTVIDKELKLFAKEGITKDILEINKEKIKANYILGLESTSSRMFANAKVLLLQNKINTQEDVIKRINNINNDDISYVLEECFKPGIISTAYVGQEIDYKKLNQSISRDIKAYDNSGQNGKIKI